MSNQNTSNLPTEMEIYLFDLRGYLILENALSPEEVKACNARLDELLPMEPDEWDGYLHARPIREGADTFQLQQIYEAGKPFEQLIDHPSWIDKLKFFIGGEGTFDWLHGPLFIDENFAWVRGPSKATGMHSGGHENVKRTQFQCKNGRFQCGQVNILIALSDMGPGDGTTMVVPGSHKSNFPHPQAADRRVGTNSAGLDGVEGAIEVHMKAGDALLFVDALSHGSATRTNEGDRRILVYRYGPSWGNFRYGYQPSPELLERLTPEQRQIVQPQIPLPRQPQRRKNHENSIN